MKIAYITGCLGFIGSYFTRKVLKEGWYVYGIDKCTYASNLHLIEEFGQYNNFKFQNTDINDLPYINDCDYVINFAAESHVDNSIKNSQAFFNSNTIGVKNLLENIKNKNSNCSNTPLFVQISTDEVYGDIDTGSHIETDILKPSNPYSASKASADMIVTAWSRTFGINYLIFRPTNNYGFGQYPEKLIPLSLKNLYRGKKIKLHNNGTPVRTWLHVQDTADAIYTGIVSGKNNEIYNISGNIQLQNIEVVQELIKHFTTEFQDTSIFERHIDYNYVRSGQDVRYSLDDTKLRDLGWSPKQDFYSNIRDIVKRTTQSLFFNE